MTVPHIFGTQPAGNVPASYLDVDFSGCILLASNAANTPTAPVWGTDYGTYTGAIVNVNGFPLTTAYGNGNAGSTPNSAALVGAINIDAADVGTFQQNGVAGFAQTAKPSGSAVALFGAAIISSSTATPSNWGINTIATNGPTISTPDNTGFDFGVLYGAEIDVNCVHKSGGIVPAGTIRGVSIFSGAVVKPTGGGYGIEIGPMSLTDAFGWDAALIIDGGTSLIGIQIGPAARSGTSIASQTLVFNSLNGASTVISSAIFDSIGNLTLLAHDNINLAVNGGSVPGGTLAMALAPTLLETFLPMQFFISGVQKAAVYSAGLYGNTLLTDAPAGASNLTWKLGNIQAGAVTADTTRSLYVDVNGTVYKLIVAT